MAQGGGKAESGANGDFWGVHPLCGPNAVIWSEGSAVEVRVRQV